MDQTLYIGDVYEEKGASIPDGWVLYISGSVDTSTAGVYEIEYYALNPETGQNVIRIKTVEVVQPGITLVGEPVITVSLPDIASYVDAGATSPDGTVLVTNLDGTASKSFTGLRSIAGSYTLIYYLSGSFSNFVTRTIHVSDPNSGGGGGGVSAPTSGPTGLDASIVSTPPASGPTGLDAVLEAEPVKPAVGYPIVGKPAVGYPIVGKPAVGYPITNIQP